ncbi:MAG TPA: glycosyltransferase family 2 protein [Candidatus Binatia bacterium]|nr:glycosyltransferase family 2 protein [Candidatus Binatia bacterium]
MIHGKRIAVVLPAYNAAKTLRQTYEELPHEIVDHVILVDDASQDETTELARQLGIETFAHPRNLGYGGNQKTCYREALRAGADVVIMVHPDYQYTPALVTAMASMVAKGIYDTVLGSRMLGTSALKGGMPRYKYVANRILTLVENIALQRKLSEYHTGYRAFSRRVLESLPLEENSNDFVFDNEMLAQIVAFDFKIGEVSCPTLYFGEASSISFLRAVRYGLGVLRVCAEYRLHRWGLRRSRLFEPGGRRLAPDPSRIPR